MLPKKEGGIRKFGVENREKCWKSDIVEFVFAFVFKLRRLIMNLLTRTEG